MFFLRSGKLMSQSAIGKVKRVYLLEGDLGRWALASVKMSAKLLLEKAGCEVVSNPLRADIIYSVWHKTLSRPSKKFLARFLKWLFSIKIVCGVTHISTAFSSEIWPFRNLVDHWVVPNSDALRMFKSEGLSVSHVPFIADKSVFFPQKLSREEICRKIGIQYSTVKDKYLIGSFQRDSEGGDLRKPKWQKNPDLLVEILRLLPRERIVLVLSSPRRHYLVGQCRKYGIPYVFVGNEKLIDANIDDLCENNQSLATIALLYNIIDLYLVTSKVEGGPMAALEAPLTRKLIMSTRVGLSPDIIHPELIYDAENIGEVAAFIHALISGEKDVSSYLNYNLAAAEKALDESSVLATYRRIIFG